LTPHDWAGKFELKLKQKVALDEEIEEFDDVGIGMITGKQCTIIAKTARYFE
jgi:hypothetical protein